MKGTSSITADFRDKGVIICRYTSEDDGQVAVSFNYLEKNGALEGEVNVMREGDPGFPEANRLYDLALTASAVPV